MNERLDRAPVLKVLKSTACSRQQKRPGLLSLHSFTSRTGSCACPPPARPHCQHSPCNRQCSQHAFAARRVVRPPPGCSSARLAPLVTLLAIAATSLLLTSCNRGLLPGITAMLQAGPQRSQRSAKRTAAKQPADDQLCMPCCNRHHQKAITPGRSPQNGSKLTRRHRGETKSSALGDSSLYQTQRVAFGANGLGLAQVT